MERERTALLEVEGIPSKGLSLYDQSQQRVSELLKINVSNQYTNTPSIKMLIRENANRFALNCHCIRNQHIYIHKRLLNNHVGKMSI